MNALRKILMAAAGGDGTPRARLIQIVVMSVLFVVPVVIIAIFAGGFWLINFTAAYAVMVALMGVNLLFGQVGLVSLSQYALVGVGGWAMLWMFHHYHWPFTISMLLSGAVSALVGVIWGMPALRFRGIYLALVTLMLAGAFQAFISAYNFPAGGGGGLERVLLDRPTFATSDVAYFIYTATTCLLGLIIVELHRRSKPGRTWALIRKSPRLATASGARIVTYQAWAFALAGFLAGIAGALLAGLYRQLDATGFGASESILLFAASILGGTTNWVGTVVGGLLMRVVPTMLEQMGVAAAIGTAIFGAGLISAVLFGPTGLAGLFDDIIDSISRKSTSRDPAQAEHIAKREALELEVRK